MAISTFQRREVKFMLTKEQFEGLMPIVHQHMNPDAYCVGGKEYGIYNIYYDTPDNFLIRTSLAKPYYKEKLRLRSYYSPAAQDASVFLEVKKKIGGIVTKRRVTLTLAESDAYLLQHKKPVDLTKYLQKQIFSELDVFLDSYPIAPKQYISYQRSAFFGKDDPDFRLTFDRNITERRYDLSLALPSYGAQIIAPNQRLMEVKIAGAMPLWLSEKLAELKIYKISFKTCLKRWNEKTGSYEPDPAEESSGCSPHLPPGSRQHRAPVSPAYHDTEKGSILCLIRYCKRQIPILPPLMSILARSWRVPSLRSSSASA